MDGADGILWFLGDLSDPWVASISACAPASWTVERTDCAESLPDDMFLAGRPPDVIVLHRNRLTTVDAGRIQSWRDAVTGRPDSVVGPRIVLCASPYLRYEELERSVSLIDDVISDAVAADVLPLRLARLLRTQRARKGLADPSLRIDVASGDEELSEMLVDACVRAGCRARAVSDRSGERLSHSLAPSNHGAAAERVLTIWDVPVLEPDWPERLGMYRRVSGAVIAVAGFVDRQVVTMAKSRGAIACLDLPCDLDDLVDLIERFANGSHPGVRFDEAHQVPPAVRMRENTRPAHRNVDAPAWPESARSSTISKSF